MGHPVEYITPVLVEISCCDLTCEPVPVQGLCLVDHCQVADDNGAAFNIAFRVSQMVEIADPGFVQQGDKGIMPHVVAVIDILDPDIQFGCIGIGAGHEK